MKARAAEDAALVWFRQDLRLADNPALAAAIASGLPILPVFVLEAEEGGRPLGGASRWWLDKSLRSLGGSLEARGSRLIVRRGDPALQILSLAQETGARLVVWNRLYDAVSVERDTVLKSKLRQGGVEVASFNASLLNEPWTVQSAAGGPFKVFTPYWRAGRARIEVSPAVAVPQRLRAPVAWPEI